MSNLFFYPRGNSFRGGYEKEISGTCARKKLAIAWSCVKWTIPTGPAAPEEFSELLASYGGGAGRANPLPLVVTEFIEPGRKR